MKKLIVFDLDGTLRAQQVISRSTDCGLLRDLLGIIKWQ